MARCKKGDRRCAFRFTKAQVEMIRERYPVEGPTRLAEEFGRSLWSIRSKASSLGVRAENAPRRIGDALARRHPTLNWRYFEDWAPNTAYILGYIWADGYVTEDALRLECVSDDEALILAIRAELGSDHAVQRWPGRRQTFPSGRTYVCRPTTSVAITSVLLAQSLRERHGLVPNKKSLDLPFPHVPDALLGHFARGLLDGDGSVGVSKRDVRPAVTFLGGRRFMVTLRDRICAAAGLKATAIITKGRTIVSFTWAHDEDVRVLQRFLYPEGEYLFLTRKREKLARALAREVRCHRRLAPGMTGEGLLALFREHGCWSEVGRALGICKSSLAYHRRRLGVTTPAFPAHWPDPAALLASYGRLRSWKAVAREFSLPLSTFTNIRRRLGL